jgi:hypothetical protein
MIFKSQTFTVSDLYNWYKAKELFLQPKFQRRKVWKPAARSYLMDTIIRGLPIPKIYFRMQVDPRTVKSVREVVDGQQRLDAIFSYVDNKFVVKKTDSPIAGGKKFKDLPEAIRSSILSFDIAADLLIGADDAQVLQIFARINSYSVTLNAQEKRNARTFGLFKESAYKLGTSHLTFWIDNNILTHQNVARMAEAELTSELLVSLIAGLQDKKSALDKYYASYADVFPNQKVVESKFEKSLSWIADNALKAMKDTIFTRRALFYSLFMAVADAIYGIEKGQGPITNFPKRLTAEQKQMLDKSLRDISNGVRSKIPPASVAEFALATARQTDNIGPRQIRHNYLFAILKSI